MAPPRVQPPVVVLNPPPPPAPAAAHAQPNPGDIIPNNNDIIILNPLPGAPLLNPLLFPIPPIPLIPIPLNDNNEQFDPMEIVPRMQWVLPFLGFVLAFNAFMHRLAITLNDVTCFRFTTLIHGLPVDALGVAERASLFASAHHVGLNWTTGGVAPPTAAAQVPAIHINMPAPLPPAPHVSNAVFEQRDQLHAFIGKYDPLRIVRMTEIYAQGTLTLQLQHLKTYVQGVPGNTYSVLSNADVVALTSGSFFDLNGIRPSEVYKWTRKLNPRIPAGPLPTELEAIAKVAQLLITYVNAELGQLILDFFQRAENAMFEYAPRLAVPLHLLVTEHLTENLFPLFMQASSPTNTVYAAAAAASTEFLVKQNLINTLLTMQSARAKATDDARAANPRGNFGAPSNGPQRADSAAGSSGSGVGGTPSPPPAGQPYHNPPPNKVQPEEYTGGALPPFLSPESGVALCYPSRSTFGRCPYASCNKQHNWTGVTPAEQIGIKRWLEQWLRKRKWEYFVKWSQNGGRPAAWPAICG